MCKLAKALFIGMDHSPKDPLTECNKSAKDVKNLLQRNFDNSPNFDCKLYLSKPRKDIFKELEKKRKEIKASGEIKEEEIKAQMLTSSRLMRYIRELFLNEADLALFYYAGHGSESEIGTSLVTQDFDRKNNPGVPFSFLFSHAVNALTERRIREVIIVIDCCFSGDMGNIPFLGGNNALLPKGLSILTSSSEDQNSFTMQGGGTVFSNFFMEGLKGAAADILGQVTILDLYNFVSRLLSTWDQRPHFKIHAGQLYSLRSTKPKIELEGLRRMTEIFPEKDGHFQLGPEYEPDLRNDKNKVPTYKVLQQYNRLGLLKPDKEEHMFYAAKNSDTCSLTLEGQNYWRLVKRKRV